MPASDALPLQPPTPLRQAMERYRDRFGHAVPETVAAMYRMQPGPLLIEIRQAIALQRPVPAWSKLAQRLIDAGGYTSIA